MLAKLQEVVIYNPNPNPNPNHTLISSLGEHADVSLRSSPLRDVSQNVPQRR